MMRCFTSFAMRASVYMIASSLVAEIGYVRLLTECRGLKFTSRKRTGPAFKYEDSLDHRHKPVWFREDIADPHKVTTNPDYKQAKGKPFMFKIVLPPHFDEDKNTWMYTVELVIDPHLSDSDAVFLYGISYYSDVPEYQLTRKRPIRRSAASFKVGDKVKFTDGVRHRCATSFNMASPANMVVDRSGDYYVGEIMEIDTEWNIGFYVDDTRVPGNNEIRYRVKINVKNVYSGYTYVDDLIDVPESDLKLAITEQIAEKLRPISAQATRLKQSLIKSVASLIAFPKSVGKAVATKVKNNKAHLQVAMILIALVLVSAGAVALIIHFTVVPSIKSTRNITP